MAIISIIPIKTFSEYPNSLYKLRTYLVYGLVIVIIGILVVQLIKYILFYPFWKPTPDSNIEQFGSRGKCKKIFKSSYEGSSAPDECEEEGFTVGNKGKEEGFTVIPDTIIGNKGKKETFTVIPDTHYFPDNILTKDELKRLASDLEYTISKNDSLAEYFNNIRLIIDSGTHNKVGTGTKRIKFDPQLDLSWVQMALLSTIPDIIAKRYNTIIMERRSIVKPDSNYIIDTLCANITIKIKKGNVNQNYQSDGNLIHSVDIPMNLDKLTVVAELSGYKTIDLYSWMLV